MSALKKERLAMANFIRNNLNELPKLIELVFKTDLKQSFRAAWVLELILREQLDLIYPYLEVFTKNLSVLKDNSAIRSCAKICELLTESYYLLASNQLSQQQKQLIIESCFDWFINTDIAVAPKAYSMQALYLLGTEFDWIHPELLISIDKNFSAQSAGYQARSKSIKTKILRSK